MWCKNVQPIGQTWRPHSNFNNEKNASEDGADNEKYDENMEVGYKQMEGMIADAKDGYVTLPNGSKISVEAMQGALDANTDILSSTAKHASGRFADEALRGDGHMSLSDAQTIHEQVVKGNEVVSKGEHWNARFVLNDIGSLTDSSSKLRYWSNSRDREFQKNNNPGLLTAFGLGGGVTKRGCMLYSGTMSSYHGPNKGKGCFKWVNSDGREIVISVDGQVETRAEYMGTFNFSTSEHVKLDMDPYFKWGNTPADVNHPTSVWDGMMRK